MVRYVGRIADRHQGSRARAGVHMSERDGGGLSSTNILFIILASLSGLVGAYWCYRRRKKRSAQTAPEELRPSQRRSRDVVEPRISRPNQPSAAEREIRRPDPLVRRGEPPKPKSMLKKENVEAALRERKAMREQEDHEMAVALQRSLNSRPAERPGEARANAAAAAAARAAGGGRPGQRMQLAPISPGSGSFSGGRGGGSCGRGGGGRGRGAPLPPLQPLSSSSSQLRQTTQYSREFESAVDSVFNEWSTRQYSSSSYLHEIGSTAREEKRAEIRDALEREWRASGRPVYEAGVQRFGPGQRLGGAGPGRRLGGGMD